MGNDISTRYEIKNPLNQKFSYGSIPPRKNPSKNHIPFENPKSNCSVLFCPNFVTPFCGLCELHCKKIHKGMHHNGTADETDDELIQKYLQSKYK